jgi:hypothetical protein
VYDSDRIAALCCSLAIDLGNCRSVGDGPKNIRYAVRDEARPVALRLEFADQRANGRIAVAGPRYVMQLRSEEPIEKGIA